MPELTTRTEPPGAVVIEPGTISPGRARGAAPLRREGPAKLTGAAKYADDLVFPGAWFGATIRSTDAHARFIGARPRSGVRLVARSWSSPPTTSPATTSSARSRPTSRSSSRSVARSSTTPSRSRSSPHRTGRRSGPPAARSRSGPSTLAGGLRPARGRHVLRRLRDGRRRPGRRLRRRRPRPRRRVPGRPPGAAVHREQRDDRRAVGRWRGHCPRLAAVPVLHPYRAASAASPSTTARRASSRRRPAAGSAARRNTRR